jgi:hypothetical protein
MILRSFSRFPNAQIDISAICITYLLLDVFEPWLCAMDEDFEARLRSNIFYGYAARNWGHHACVASTEVEQLILDFLESEAKVSTSSQTMMATGRYSSYGQKTSRQMTGVHIAAYFGPREEVMARQAGRVDHVWLTARLLPTVGEAARVLRVDHA